MAAFPTWRDNAFYEEADYALLGRGYKRKEPGDARSPFQIDRDRVVFSHAFRRLQSKTQVFQSGEYDFYRTRLTHSIEVARISRSICEHLRACSGLLGPDYFIDPDLLEAAGFAHDLGHPPFGHIGERKLNQLMSAFGGFEGNAQTARILCDLHYERPSGSEGMNPTRAFLDSVMKYKALHHEMAGRSADGTPLPASNHFLYSEQADLRAFIHPEPGNPPDLNASAWNSLKSIECQIMDWADDTAYSLHDILDGFRAGFLGHESIRQWTEARAGNLSNHQQGMIDALMHSMSEGHIESTFGGKVGHFVRACSLAEGPVSDPAGTNRYRYGLCIDPAIHEECRLYKAIANDLIFQSPSIQQIEFKGGRILKQLFEGLADNLPGRKQSSLDQPLKMLPPAVLSLLECQRDEERSQMRILCDFLSGLTDSNATRLYRRLFDAGFGSITDLA